MLPSLNYVTVDVDSRKRRTFKIALKLLLGVIYAKTGKKNSEFELELRVNYAEIL